MKFSILKEKITPDIPVLQMGFPNRTHKSEGVHDDPYVSIVLIQANETVVILSLDVVYGDRSFASGIKEAIYKKYGLRQDKIIINYSHTHSFVAVTGDEAGNRAARPYSMTGNSFLWGEDWDDIDFSEDIRFYHSVKQKVLDMIEKGYESAVEGEIHICKGESRFGVSRRFPSEEGILWKPNFDENCMDPDLFLLKFVDSNSRIRGLVYSYACHASTLGYNNYLISADYPGVVRRVLEDRNPGMTAVFLQGCGADIKPYISAENGRFKSCTYDELEQAGRRLAGEIQEYIDAPAWRQVETDVSTGYSEVKLYTATWSAEKWQDMYENHEVSYYRDSAKQMLKRIKDNRISNYLPYYMSFIKLDDQTYMLFLECEVVTDIGKEIKKLFKEDIIVQGYSNSISCYIPTKKILEDGGYERESFIPNRLPGPFEPEIEDIIVGRASLMLKSGRK